jgi:hypothetical protein
MHDAAKVLSTKITLQVSLNCVYERMYVYVCIYVCKYASMCVFDIS